MTVKANKNKFRLIKQWQWVKKHLVWPFYKINFKFHVWLHGGSLSIKKKLKLQVPVCFQGEGRVSLGNRVQLGHWMAGANQSAILLQPREANAQICIGDKSFIMNGSELMSRSRIEIGSHCLIGAQVKIIDADFHGVHPDKRSEAGISQPIIIEDNVWVGANSIVLKGVNIGKNSIIGAGSVVTKSIPANVIAAGNPAKIISDINTT